MADSTTPVKGVAIPPTLSTQAPDPTGPRPHPSVSAYSPASDGYRPGLITRSSKETYLRGSWFIVGSSLGSEEGRSPSSGAVPWRSCSCRPDQPSMIQQEECCGKRTAT